MFSSKKRAQQRRDVCRFCFLGELDVKDRLIAPCACYKKLEYNRAHVACLEKYIREQRVDKVSDGTTRQLLCETCGSELKIKFHWEFIWAMERLMSGTSLHTCFEFWALALTFFGFVFTFFTVLLRDPEIQENKWTFGVCITLLGIMTISTLHVVYKRWKVAQSDCVVLDSEV